MTASGDGADSPKDVSERTDRERVLELLEACTRTRVEWLTLRGIVKNAELASYGDGMAVVDELEEEGLVESTEYHGEYLYRLTARAVLGEGTPA